MEATLPPSQTGKRAGWCKLCRCGSLLRVCAKPAKTCQAVVGKLSQHCSEPAADGLAPVLRGKAGRLVCALPPKFAEQGSVASVYRSVMQVDTELVILGALRPFFERSAGSFGLTLLEFFDRLLYVSLSELWRLPRKAILRFRVACLDRSVGQPLSYADNFALVMSDLAVILLALFLMLKLVRMFASIILAPFIWWRVRKEAQKFLDSKRVLRRAISSMSKELQDYKHVANLMFRFLISHLEESELQRWGGRDADADAASADARSASARISNRELQDCLQAFGEREVLCPEERLLGQLQESREKLSQMSLDSAFDIVFQQISHSLSFSKKQREVLRRLNHWAYVAASLCLLPGVLVRVASLSSGSWP